MRSWVIGSGDDCDLVVSRPTVSGRHCCLLHVRDGFLLQDLRSSNGTFVNGERIRSLTPVTRGDAITLGNTEPMPWPEGGGESASITHIGRKADNDVVLDLATISSYHARVVHRDGRYTIEDLGSSNGTFLRDDVRVTARVGLSPDQTVALGTFRIPAARLLPRSAGPATPSHHAVAMRGFEMVLGRDPGCDQVLDYPMISGRHARFVRTGKQFFVEDLGSSNGTFVNGRRIKESVAVGSGDVIGLGSFTFTLTGSGEFDVRDRRGAMTLEARGVSVEVPRRRLIEDVSLTIRPAEFVGLMGPSGAGKTTLMAALNGYTRPSRGAVTLNGDDLYANYNRFRGQIGYVPQEDIIHRDLTVGQALYYTARLRLPTDYRDADIRARVRAVLEQLGLAGTEGVVVGSPEKKGISGGQRKRVNLAMELLTDPSVLFLDEPTSGLSSEDTLMVMRLLRRLADEGKTILLTIHQPSLDAFRLLDNLVLVSKDPGSSDPGRLVYYGPAYPDAVHFFNPGGVPNARPGVEPAPDEVLRGLSKGKTEAWAAAYAGSRYRRAYVADRAAGESPAGPPPAVPRPSRETLKSQRRTLVRRTLAIKLKDTWNTAILLAQAPIIAALVTLVFGKDARGEIAADDPMSWATVTNAVSTTLFDMVLAAVWFGCSNSAREIVGERAIYLRERMVNLNLRPYVASKFAVLGGLCVLQCLVLLGIVHRGSGLKGPWIPMFLILVLASGAGLAVGLLVSAVAKTSEMAIALVPLIVLPMLILGGAMQPVHKMDPLIRPFTALMPSRWAFEGLLVLEAEAQPKHRPLGVPSDPIKPGRKLVDMAEGSFPADDHRWGFLASGFVLTVMLIALFATNLAVLKFKDANS